MKYKWLQNKLTFVIIPEANGSVVRFKLSRAVIGGALALLLALLGALGLVSVRHWPAGEASALDTAEATEQADQLKQTIENKNKTIEQLKHDIVSLSKQAAEVHHQMEQMKRLEQDIQKLAPGVKRPTAAMGQTAALPASAGMGGPQVAVSSADIQRLAAATGQRYAALQTEMHALGSRFTMSKRLLLERVERRRRTPDVWPTLSRIVTSPYGYRKDPFNRKLSFHRGIDIAGKMNDPVYAAASGTVHKVGYDKLHGHNVVIEHSQNIRTWYMHLNRADVRPGQRLEKGAPIGRLGSTGRSTGPHLHYEVLLSGKSTNPAPYLPELTKKGSHAS